MSVPAINTNHAANLLKTIENGSKAAANWLGRTTILLAVTAISALVVYTIWKRSQPKRALLLIDIQNDFLPGGALEVKEGDKVVPVANKLLQKKWTLVAASQDWHPADHGSFASNHIGKKPYEVIKLGDVEKQTLWPVHCVQGTKGALFASDLDTKKVKHTVVQKGMNPKVDSYSAFFENDRKTATTLEGILKAAKIDELYVAGLATDYCVRYSVLDARKLGFKTFVVEDGCRGVNLEKDDSKNALAEMVKEGAVLVTSDQVMKT